MRRAQWTLVGLAALLALAVVVSVDAQVPAPRGSLGTFSGEVARAAKEKDATVDRILKAFGPAIADQLRAGRTVEVPGVGTFRVVRVGEYRDLVNGLVTTFPARNYVEFVPSPELNTAANAPGAVPARIIQGYEFRVETDRVPSIRATDIKTSRWRVP